MKILQLNIWGGKLGKQISELIVREQPDIICFQEAVEMSGKENFFVATLAELTEGTDYTHQFFSPSFAFKHMNRKAHWGNAIVSKLPFTATEDFFTRGAFVDDFDLLEGDYNLRVLQRATVLHNGKPLHILNHHGHHVREHKLGNEETMRQCTMIAAYIQTLTGDIVLAGDFNLSPESESLGLLNGLLTNQCIAHDVDTTRTVLTHKKEVLALDESDVGDEVKHYCLEALALAAADEATDLG